MTIMHQPLLLQIITPQHEHQAYAIRGPLRPECLFQIRIEGQHPPKTHFFSAKGNIPHLALASSISFSLYFLGVIPVLIRKIR